MWVQNTLQSMEQDFPSNMKNYVILEQNYEELIPKSNKALRCVGSQEIEESCICTYFKAVHWLDHYSDTDTADSHNHELLNV